MPANTQGGQGCPQANPRPSFLASCPSGAKGERENRRAAEKGPEGCMPVAAPLGSGYSSRAGLRFYCSPLSPEGRALPPNKISRTRFGRRSAGPSGEKVEGRKLSGKTAGGSQNPRPLPARRARSFRRGQAIARAEAQSLQNPGAHRPSPFVGRAGWRTIAPKWRTRRKRGGHASFGAFPPAILEAKATSR
jgi:hypothetical protein